MVKLATWNVNSLRVRLPQVLEWLQANSPDIVCLQETKVEDGKFPLAEINAAGYQAVYTGQKTYNGVATLARSRAHDVLAELPGIADEQKRFLALSIDGLRVIDVYVPNGSAVGSDKYRYKLDWLDALRCFIEAEIKRHPRLVMAGDFNIAPEDRDVHDPVAWQGAVLVSDEERAAFQGLLDVGLHDCFRLFEQAEGGYSWWDYRAAAFRRNRGLRIDHILCGQALAGQCRQCLIDTAPRALERPSDHAPVVAEFSL